MGIIHILCESRPLSCLPIERFSSTKNIVHLAVSAKNKDDSNK